MAQTYNSSAIYTSSFGKESIRRITSADINNDGSQDIVFSEGKYVTVLINDKGSFRKSIQIETSFDRVGEIVGGDFNKDGQMDIAYSGNGMDIEICFLKDNGLRGDFRQRISTGGSNSRQISDLKASDLNNDGYLDIVTGGSVAVLENKKGTFILGQILAGTTLIGSRPINSVKNIAQGNQNFDWGDGLMYPMSLTILDVNKDGYNDIVTASGSSDFNRVPYAIDIIYGNGNSSFTNFSTVEIERKSITNIGITDVISGDFNNDKIQDIVTINGNMLTGTFFKGTESENVHPFTSFKESTWINGPADILYNNVKMESGKDFVLPDSPWNAVVGDFNSDKNLDIAFTDYRLGIGGVYIMEGNGNGNFTKGLKYPTGMRPEGIVTADFNGDGYIDIATANAARWDGGFGGENIQPSVTLILSSIPTPTYTLTPTASSINEGSTLTTSVATTDVASGTALYYSLSGTGINTTDFSSGALTGSGTVGSNGSFTFSHTFANDLTTEGTETLNIKLYADSSRSTQVGSTASVSIADTSVPALPTFSVSTTASTINEGDGFTTTLTTTGVAAGTTYYWVRSGSGITSTDFIYGGLSGSASIGSDGKFSYTHLTENDLTTEGDEAVGFRVFSDSNRSQQVGSTASILIRDTSITPAVSGVTVNGNNSGIANSGTITNNGTINTGTQTTNSNNTTTNTNNTTNNNINNFFTYYTNTTNNTNSNNTVMNTNSNNTISTWNIYRVDNSVKAGDIVNQWFGTATPTSTQLQDISETKLMDVVASTWADKVQINRVVKASDTGGKIEAKQIEVGSGEVAGSVVSGGKGSDDIKGFAGWDNLEGDEGNDLIHGGNGRDIISGGAGRDELHGDFGWNTFKSEKDGVSDLIAVKSDQFLVNWLYGKAGNSPNGEKADIIEGLDSIDKIKLIGIDTREITFAANISAKGVTGIGIYGKGILEALYTGGDLTVSQITQMTSGDASAAAMSNSVNAYGVW